MKNSGTESREPPKSSLFSFLSGLSFEIEYHSTRLGARRRPRVSWVVVLGSQPLERWVHYSTAFKVKDGGVLLWAADRKARAPDLMAALIAFYSAMTS